MASSFVYPLLTLLPREGLDPDRTIIRDDQARGAILFGPPGTSKTTLARAVAAAVSWDYVELHASHFVADGLPNVQRTADEIFKRLGEIDKAVVLFDEIDELVREREDKAADVFGRFLTTSMLPKLAELWALRKILFFVATNHVAFFDAAVIRSQRFDSLLFVPPPSFDSKKQQLVSLIKRYHPEIARVRFDIRENAIQEVVSRLDDWIHDRIHEPNSEKNSALRSCALPPEYTLAKFLLLRWDQLDELAYLLGNSCLTSSCRVSAGKLEDALGSIRDPRLSHLAPYIEYFDDLTYGRRDYSKTRVWKLDGNGIHDFGGEIFEFHGDRWLRSCADLATLGQRYELDSRSLATLRALRH